MANNNKLASLYGNHRPWTAFLMLLLFVFIGMFVGQFFGFLAMLPLTGVGLEALSNPNFLADIMSDPTYKRAVMIMNACVATSAFIVAPLVYLYGYAKMPLSIFFNNNNIITIPLLLTIFIVIAFMTVNSIFIEWNAKMELPEFLRGFEAWAKRLEEQAEVLTQMMTRFDNKVDLGLALIVIAVVPAVGEELLFRGLIQNQLGGITKNAHVAIWLAAIIFSAFHFQFYGFVPRMLLGALFGYLYYWSGNLLVPIFAHLMNNGLTLILLYMYQHGAIEFDIESETSVPFTNIIFSLVLVVALIFYFRRYFAVRVKDHG
jgi:membrane protease YdiL (CAAX protease family)